MSQKPHTIHRRTFHRIAALVGLVALAPAGVALADPCDDSGASADVIIYRHGEAIPQDELVDLGDPADLGGDVLEGTPRISARVDFAAGTFTAGVFQATRGTVRIHFPFTEHATILAGSVELTDSTGAHATLYPGDSYLITQGSDILWEVRGARVQKSFANRVEAQDSPGPMRIYYAGDAAAHDDLVDLGSPEALGGQVLAGDPEVAARFDLPDASAGVMRTTSGAIGIDFAFAAHAAVAVGRLGLIDDLGDEHTLRPGDAYFVRPGTLVEWDIGARPVEQSFFHTAL